MGIPRRRLIPLRAQWEKEQAKAIIEEEWGYPRPLDNTDLCDMTLWYRLGTIVYVWFQLLENGDLLFHVARDPQQRYSSTGSTRRFKTLIEFIGDLTGASRLVASDCAQGGMVASYLDRLGFEIDPDYPGEKPINWYVKDL